MAHGKRVTGTGAPEVGMKKRTPFGVRNGFDADVDEVNEGATRAIDRREKLESQ